MICNRCGGSGELTIRLGKPGHTPHTRYTGLWCVYPTHRCPVCHGHGVKNSRPNLVAGMRVHFDVEGRPVTRETMSAEADGNEET